MKKFLAYLLVAFLILSLCACSKNLTDKNDITRLFQKNEQSFLTAAETGDWEQLEKIRGINDVFVLDAYIDIQCGGAGFGPSPIIMVSFILLMIICVPLMWLVPKTN